MYLKIFRTDHIYHLYHIFISLFVYNFIILDVAG